MIARLWWKEYRQFWPIWLTVAGGALLSQWMMIGYFGNDVRNGWLVPAALLWGCLYAVAVGAAAFAGERELKTLVLLDTMPVGRGTLWGGKVSFGLLSTSALAAFLFVIANAATTNYDPRYDLPTIVLGCGLVILEALCWGFFWSSVSKSALAAATLAIFSLLTILITVGAGWAFGQGMLNAALQRAVVMAITLGTSAAVMTARKRPSGRWRAFEVELQTPVVVRPNPSRARRGYVTTWESWTTAVRRLTWETVREGRATWSLLLLIGVTPYLLVILASGNLALPLAMMGNMVIALTAGISLFGPETRSGTYRFLASHGVRPGAVWGTKLAVWSLGLTLLWSPYLLFAATGIPQWSGTNNQVVLIYAAFVMDAFAVAQLSGMVIRRGITSWFVAILCTIGMVVPQAFLLVRGMLTVGWLLAPPVAMLVVSWAWSGDWLIIRPGLGRWVRLALLLLGTFTVTATSYAAHRVLSVPDFGPKLDRQFLQLDTAAVPDASNAAGMYREAAGLIPAREGGATKLQEGHSMRVSLIRQALAMPSCQFRRLDSCTAFDWVDAHPIQVLGEFLKRHARDGLSRGDLKGAWNDILLMVQMARQVGRKAPLNQSAAARKIEEEALAIALTWANDPRQTPEGLKAALAEFLALPAPAPAGEPLRVEARILEQTLDLPIDRLREKLTESNLSNMPSERFWHRLWVDMETTPWEIARARRAFRLLLASEASLAETAPWRRTSYPAGQVGFPDFLVHEGADIQSALAGDLEKIFEQTPLVKQLLPTVASYINAQDRLEVDRRALPQVLAIRVWQLTYGGKVSETLDPMLTPLLSPVSTDPYSNRPFGWAQYDGERLVGMSAMGGRTAAPMEAKSEPVEGQWFLYSVGPDLRDDQGRFRATPNNTGPSTGDILYPIPKASPPAEKPLEAKP